MAERVYACRVDDVPLDSAKIIKIRNHSVGIFRLDDGFYALLNVCPHRGGQLCEGPKCGTAKTVDKAEFIYDRPGELVRCAWHGWEFDIRTGQMLTKPFSRARRFEVMVENDEELYINI